MEGLLSLCRRLEHDVECFLDTLFGLCVDYESLALNTLDVIDETIAKQEKAVEKNWGGDVDAVRAEAVAQILNDLREEGTRTGRWEADALLVCYHRIYDEPLPAVEVSS